MRLVIEEVALFSGILKDVEVLTDQALFKFSSEGLRVRSMDAIRVAMVDLHLPTAFFTEFQVPEAEVKVGVNLEELGKIMDRGKEAQSLEVVYEAGGKLNFSFLRKGTKASFNVSPIDLGADDLPVPKLDFTASAKLFSLVLSEAIKDVGVVGDMVRFEADSDLFKYSLDGDNSVLGELRRGSEALLDLDVKEKTVALYALNYLGDMLKVSKVLGTVILEFGGNLPLLLTFPVEGSEGVLRYFLAPKVEGGYC